MANAGFDSADELRREMTDRLEEYTLEYLLDQHAISAVGEEPPQAANTVIRNP